MAREVVFKKTVIDREFRSEGVAVADVNRDGRLDILAGNLWYEAPRWEPHEIRPPEPFDPASGYSNSFLNWSADVDGDGWPDQVLVGFPGKPALWRENPRGAGGHWPEHLLGASACNESPAFVDLLGTGQAVLVCGFDEAWMGWHEPLSDPRAPFRRYGISVPGAPGTKRYAHGLGVGDLNRDGRPEVLTTRGYWVSPPDPRSGAWEFVAADLGPDCAQMLVYDVNGDGWPDVISSSAHGKGIWWWEQLPGPDGPTFRQHLIDDGFSQSHALVLADIDGDGVMDLVAGKRFWAHGPNGDVEPNHPAVLYWYRLVRDGGEVSWVPHRIDDDSGVGTQFVVADVNGDGRLDIVTANKKGVFYFEQQ
jgi:hypothetical protein